MKKEDAENKECFMTFNNPNGVRFCRPGRCIAWTVVTTVKEIIFEGIINNLRRYADSVANLSSTPQSRKGTKTFRIT